ncbi:glycosyltransferase family 2 protein [Candidatus Woesebacteria bacterium]|nr:glycosyltransferase family 2 protein [Candidatus Woesebacteria bacterium]
MKKISLSVIMPVFNEERTVLLVLKKLVRVSAIKEIIVVDDGSTDTTLRKLKKISSKKIKVFHKKNGGKGSAIQCGLRKVTSEYVLIQDADLEYDPDDIPRLIAPIEKRGVKIVFGSRFLGPHLNLLFWHWVGNHLLNTIVNLLYNTTLSDLETCYKVLPTNVFRSLQISSNNFDIEPEITCKLLRKGYKIFEVPITYMGRDYSEGKKITWRDGFSALQTIIWLRFW